jgi:hypothetical protein
MNSIQLSSAVVADNIYALLQILLYIASPKTQD